MGAGRTRRADESSLRRAGRAGRLDVIPAVLMVGGTLLTLLEVRPRLADYR